MAALSRPSKFKNIDGRPFRKDECYDGVRIPNTSADANVIKVNSSYISVTWETTGGGAFAVLPINGACKLPEGQPLFMGHKCLVNDTDFNPFNDKIIASASDDCTVMVWDIPEDLTASQAVPKYTLMGHERRVNAINFHPTAANVLGSASTDGTIRVWDVVAQRDPCTLESHGDAVHSFAFDWPGNSIVSTCRDKKLRVFDLRTRETVNIIDAHDSLKISRATYAAETGYIISSGFDKSSERQIKVWDTRNMKNPVSKTALDRSPSVLQQFYDRETGVLFVAGKGDSSIMMFEHSSGELASIQPYKSSDPQRGVAFMPKLSCCTAKNEIARAYKVHASSQLIEPVSFEVPRRAKCYQADLYPPTPSPEPSLTAEEWFSGESKDPILMEMGASKPTNASSASLANPSRNVSSENLSTRAGVESAEIKNLKAQLANKDEKIKELEEKLQKALCGIGMSDPASPRAESADGDE